MNHNACNIDQVHENQSKFRNYLALIYIAFKCSIGLSRQELNLIRSRKITNKQNEETKEKIIFQSPFYKKKKQN